MTPGPDGWALGTFKSGTTVTTEITNMMLDLHREGPFKKPVAKGKALKKPAAADNVLKRPAQATAPDGQVKVTIDLPEPEKDESWSPETKRKRRNCYISSAYVAQKKSSNEKGASFECQVAAARLAYAAAAQKWDGVDVD